MRPAYDELTIAFVERQRAKGVRNLKRFPIELAVYFRWLDDHGIDVAAITPAHAEEYQTYLATKETNGKPHYASLTVQGLVGTVNTFYHCMVEDGRALANPFRTLRRIKTGRALPRSIPTQAEMAELLERFRTFWKAPFLRDRRIMYRVHVMMEVLYATGMRINELATLRPDDIDFAGKTVRIREGKGGVARIAYLNDYAARVLSVYLTEMRDVVISRKNNPALFGTVHGASQGSTLNVWLKRACGITSHAFRHAVGTHLLQRGCDLRYIQLILGHEDLDSTAVYTKVSKEDLRNELDACHPRRN